MEDIFLFVLGYLIQLAACCLLCMKITQQRSIYGLSTSTQICFCVANVGRCVWTLETRLVETKVAYAELLGSTLAGVAAVYLCRKWDDGMNHQLPNYLEAPFLMGLSAVLAFFFHPGEDWISLQILVAFTMYLEALGMIPQLWLMRKTTYVEPLTSHYVLLIVVSRLCRMIFWGVLFFRGEHFLQLFLFDLMHTVCAADYVYLWVKKLRTGGKLVYAI